MKKLFLFLLSFIPILSFGQGVYQATGDLKQTGNYPIIWDKNVKGAPQGRATKAQMLAIPASFRDTSMTCYVIETDSTYRLKQDLVTWVAVSPGNIALALQSVRDTLSTKLNKSLKGAPYGLAELDNGGKVPMSQMPASLFIYKGMYNPNTNIPALSDATGVQGWVYQINIAGVHNFGSGSVTLNVGDYVIHNGSIWQKSAGTGYVTSVNNKQGIVSLTTDDIVEGTNQYYTNTRAIGSTLTGYSSSSGSISASDNIVGAIGKLNGNITALSSVYIQNQNTGSQAANFNINGSGTANNFTLSGTDGSGNLFLPMQTSKPTAPISGMKFYNQNGPAWITSNGFSRTLSWPSTTADHIATFTDANGTVPFLESAQTWSGINTFGVNPIVKSALPAITLTETTNGYSSVLTKTAALNQLSLTHQIYQAGGQGAAITLNGTSQYGTFTTTNVITSGNPFTFTSWFKTTATNTTQPLFSVSANNGGINIGIATDGGITQTYNGGSGTSFNTGITSTSTRLTGFNDGQWHQLIFVYTGVSGSGAQWYVDGNAAGGTNQNFGLVPATLGYIGRTQATFGGSLLYFNGEIDQTMFYNRALSTNNAGVNEIALLYNSGFGTPSPVISGLVSRWEFDEGTGAIANDATSAATTISFINTPSWDLNGKVAKLGSITTGTGFSFINGVNNTEKGQWIFGDIQGGFIAQGKSIRALVNGKYALLMGVDGHTILDPMQLTSLPDVNGSYNANSIFKLGPGTASVAPIQFSNGIYNTTPQPGSLEYNGAFSFSDATASRYSFVGLEKNQTFTGFNTFGGTIIGSNGLTRGLYINPSLQFSANNENQYVLDIAGSSISNIGGSSIKGIVTISNGGSGYAGGGSGNFNNVRLTGGTGTGALATVTITSGVITNITVPVTSSGLGYLSSDILSVNNADLGGTGSGASLILSVGWVNGALYSIRHANSIVPNAAGSTNVGSSTLYYANVYSSTGQFADIKALTGNILTFRAQNGSVMGSIGSTGNWLIPSIGVGPTDNNYKLDVQGSGLYGSFRSSGTIQNNTSTAAANLFSNTLNPTVNNQNLILADFTGTFGTGGSSLGTGIISPSNYNVTTNPTSTGTASIIQSATSGSGSGAIFSVVTTVGGVTSIQITNGGSGYAIGNTITLTANGGTIIYTIPTGGIGLTGVNTYAARFNNKLNFIPTTLVATPVENAFEWDGSNLYMTNSSAIRNQLAYLNTPIFTGTPQAPTAAPGTNTNQIATTAFVLANSKPANYVPTYAEINGTPDLSVYATLSYVNSTFKPAGYIPAWNEISNKPSFFSGSYNDLNDKPTLFSGSYTDLNNKPTLFSGSYTDLSNKPTLFSGQYSDLSGAPEVPNSFDWFGDKLLTNLGGQPFPLTNSNAGSKLYIATNWSGGYAEVNYFAIPGTTSSARGHHAFYTVNPHEGTSGGVKFDFGSQGDNNAFVTGGPLAPNTVDHLEGSPNRVPVFDINTNTIYYRTPQELASDLGYALGTGYAVLNGDNTFSGNQYITGNITASGNITTTSDARVKKNIVELGYATDNLKNIKAVSFDRTDITKQQIGVIAQNLQKYYPLLVEKDANGMLSVNYSMFSAVLLKGWQEQQKEIENLKVEIKNLKK